MQIFSKRFGRSWRALDNTLFKQYQQLLKREKRYVRVYQLIILLLFFGGWELLSRLEWIDRLILARQRMYGIHLLKK